MATKPAPDRRHETLREKETGVLRTGVHPIDAREMIASGAYEYVTDAEAPAAAAPATTAPTVQTGATPPADPPEDPDALPTVAKLPAALAAMDSADAIIAMSVRDPRATAQPLYEARLAELEAKP